MTGAGQLNRRLILEEPLETPDGAGGVARAYGALTTLWAQVTPLAARGEFAADAFGASITHRITIRARDDVTTRHRLREGTRIYRIAGLNLSGDRRFLEIHAQERAD
ncbi:MAG: phage head closure protein [Proteobacteria bacterium]|nr:phage head closure protein [Pseudomonadota bacterium]